MCKHGTDTLMQVFIPARLSHTGEDHWTEKAVDSCIAPIVKALLDAGIMTTGSCCGHGKEPGDIHLLDGRVLVIARDAEEARRFKADAAPP